jgi:hypothetical protein
MGNRRFTRLTNAFSKRSRTTPPRSACSCSTTTSPGRTGASASCGPQRWPRA